MSARYDSWNGKFGEPTPLATTPCRGPGKEQLERLKEQLLVPLLSSVTNAALVREVRSVANEAAALAWVTDCPLLVLPALLEEKIRAALQRWERQQRLWRGPVSSLPGAISAPPPCSFPGPPLRQWRRSNQSKSAPPHAPASMERRFQTVRCLPRLVMHLSSHTARPLPVLHPPKIANHENFILTLSPEFYFRGHSQVSHAGRNRMLRNSSSSRR